MSALSRLTLTEARLFLRDPASVAFGALLAPALMVILGFVPPFRLPDPDLGGLRIIDLYAPILVGTAIASLALTVLPQLLAGYRQQGILRRMRTTPVRPSLLLGAQLLMCTGVAVVSAAVVLLLGRLVHGVQLPVNPLGYLLAVLLTATAVMTLGLLIGALAPSGTAAGGIGPLFMVPLLFLAGLWLPREAMNDTLRLLSDLSPLGAGVASLQHAAVGDWPEPGHIAAMLGWSIVVGLLASRVFRWE